MWEQCGCLIASPRPIAPHSVSVLSTYLQLRKSLSSVLRAAFAVFMAWGGLGLCLLYTFNFNIGAFPICSEIIKDWWRQIKHAGAQLSQGLYYVTALASEWGFPAWFSNAAPRHCAGTGALLCLDECSSDTCRSVMSAVCNKMPVSRCWGKGCVFLLA